ncbi:MAG: metallophosphoesterase [Deltaproteobacteria bacterium]|nr:metallophosphoesterase [Deltaproteobacteria bacterium]
MVTRRGLLRGAAVGAMGLPLYTWRLEPSWVAFEGRDLPIDGLPAGLAGRRLVQLSDIHIGAQVDDGYVVETFKSVTSLKPDFVVFTGDLISYRSDAELDQARHVLEHFPRGRLGTVAVLGNHDYGPGWSSPSVAGRVEKILLDAGATVLRNAATVLAGLQFVGLDDLWSPRFNPGPILQDIGESRGTVVLCHNPDAADLPVWGAYRGWILAGHTHGGQCKPPFLPPPVLPVRNSRYTSGAFALSGGRSLYINRGVGHLIRVRFNVRPEVTVFRLVPA